MSTMRCKEHKEIDPKMVVLPVEHYQYASWRCAECDKWLCFAKWPRTSERLQTRQKTIRNIIYSSPVCTHEDLHELLLFYHIVDLPYYKLEKYQELISKLIMPSLHSSMRPVSSSDDSSTDSE